MILSHIKPLLFLSIPLIILLQINFLYYHVLIEAYTVAICVTIFVVTINTRNYINNSFYTFIGVSFLSVGFIDFIHSLTYKGMTVFSLMSANMATQYWIFGRYIHAISLLVSLFFVTRKIGFSLICYIYFAIVLLGFLSISYGIFPTAYIDGVGQSNFKIISEFVIIAILTLSLLNFKKARSHFDDYFYKMFRMGIILSALAELVFVMYVDVYSYINAFGHLLKMSAFYFFYRACIFATLNRPIENIFLNLNENRRFLNSIIESLTYPFYVIDVYTKRIKMANTASGLNNYSEKSCFEVTDYCQAPCGNPTDSCPIETIQHTKKPLIFEKECKDNDGNKRYFEVHTYPIINQKGEVDEIIEYCFDITKSKLERLKIEILSLAIEQSSNSIIITDSDGIIEYVNSTFCKTTGYTIEEVIGKKPSILKSGLMPQELYEDLWKTITSGKIWRGEICNKIKSGDLIWEFLTITPLKDPSGKITHFVGIREDMTDKLRAEIAEKRALENERKVLELEKELQSLDNLISLHQPTITARVYGQLPLKEAMPEIFDELERKYIDLFEKYIETQVYKTNYDIMEDMKQYIDNLGTLRAGPRELIDIHTSALKFISKGMSPEKSQAYINEGKIMLIELMGYLVNFYRNYFVTRFQKKVD